MGPLKKISMKDKVGLVKPLVVIATLVLVGTVCDVAIAQRTLLADPPKSDVHKISPGKIPTTPQPAEGEVLLKYSESVLPGKTPQERARQMDKLALALRSKFNITVLSNTATLGVQRIKLPVGLSIVDAIAALTKEAGIEHVSPNYKIYLATSPNDPEWAATDISPPDFNLWGLRKIGMERAWDNSGGHMGSVIAVIDSGIDYLHPDLAANMWTNPGEKAGDGTDNDGNGIVDDIHGANFCTNPPSGSPMDTVGHGTLVAGTIGAVGDNNRDVVGVNWYAKLMALKFICYTDQNGVPYGLVSDAIDAIVYATDHNVPVMNNSWQVAGSSLSSLDLSDLGIAIRRANCELLPSPGCQPALFVAAAGNADGVNPLNNDLQPTYPASFPNVFAVAATDKNDRLWPDSHWGPKSVHIAAPGVDIESTYLRGQFGGLSVTDGTSMAAPHVAGCAAILQARQVAREGRRLPIEKLKRALMSRGDSSKALAGKIVSGKRLNCGMALSGFP